MKKLLFLQATSSKICKISIAWKVHARTEMETALCFSRVHPCIGLGHPTPSKASGAMTMFLTHTQVQVHTQRHLPQPLWGVQFCWCCYDPPNLYTEINGIPQVPCTGTLGQGKATWSLCPCLVHLCNRSQPKLIALLMMTWSYQ